MNVVPNQAGGTTIVLKAGEGLDTVPESHRDLVTPALRVAFADPIAYFGQIAARAPIAELGKWLKALVAGGKWSLLLHEGFMMERELLATFQWQSRDVRSAAISLPQESLSPRLSEVMRQYYSLVDVVHWDDYGCAGGILGQYQHIRLIAFSGLRPKRKGYDPKNYVVWGNSSCGDMLIYTTAGKAAYLSHENGKVNALGTMEEALNWVFDELLQYRTPEFDYAQS
jgi:hypothetical protein